MNVTLFFETLTLCTIAAASPGPNFFMTVANTNQYGRQAGIMTALGIGFGVTFWLFVCGFGLALIISENTLVQKLLSLGVVFFLIYLGIKIIKDRDILPKQPNNAINISNSTKFSFFRIGLIGTLLNGGVGIFYAAIFAKIVIEYGKNYGMILFHILTFNIVEFAWFLFVAFFVAYARNFMRENSKKINVFLGVAMFYFAVKIAYGLI